MLTWVHFGDRHASDEDGSLHNGVGRAEAPALSAGEHRLRVTAYLNGGSEDSDAIVVHVASGKGARVARGLKANPGDHIHSIGAWAEHGLLATQLGPNKNGAIKW